MSLKAGFAEIDITPPVGTLKLGWIKRLVSDRVLDPLFARAAVIESGDGRIGFVQLDTLSIRWTQVSDLRRRIEEAYGFPGSNIMVSATHNHAGPAVAGGVEFERDEAYVETLVTRAVEVFGQALEGAQEAELGFGKAFEFNVAFNRRVIMRDGTVKTHGNFRDPGALCLEGPIDPEVAVLAFRARDTKLLGVLANFTCHPTHHGGEGILSAGYPGVFATEMKARGCPVSLFLNGAAGNIHTSDAFSGGPGVSMEEAGTTLAKDVSEILETVEYTGEVEVGSRSATVQLPVRDVTDAEIRGTVRGAQRFIDSTLYDKDLPNVLERIQRMGTQPAEVQVQSIGNVGIVGIPAEYFVQHGLRIKEESHPRHALVSATTNGMGGYVPHKEAFLRGGYETTFWTGSRLAPEAGDILADKALELLREGV